MDENEVDEPQTTDEPTGEPTGETEGTVGEGDDSQVGRAVDERAAELTGTGGASDESPRAGSDPIAQAEAHLEDVDLDEERKKLQELQDKM